MNIDVLQHPALAAREAIGVLVADLQRANDDLGAHRALLLRLHRELTNPDPAVARDIALWLLSDWRDQEDPR